MSNSNQIDINYLTSLGWSTEGADLLITNREHPKLRSFFKRLARNMGIEISFSANRKKKASIPIKLRWAIWERDNFTCLHCGDRRYLSIDHITPESMGGTLHPENLQTLCQSCNSKKGTS